MILGASMVVVLLTGCTGDDPGTRTNTNAGGDLSIKKEKFNVEILCMKYGVTLTIMDKNSYDHRGCTLIVNDKFYFNGGESNFNLIFDPTSTYSRSDYINEGIIVIVLEQVNLSDFYTKNEEPMYDQRIYNYTLKCADGRKSGYC